MNEEGVLAVLCTVIGQMPLTLCGVQPEACLCLPRLLPPIAGFFSPCLLRPRAARLGLKVRYALPEARCGRQIAV